MVLNASGLLPSTVVLHMPLVHSWSTLILLGPLRVTTLWKLRTKVYQGGLGGPWAPWSWVLDQEHCGPVFTFCRCVRDRGPNDKTRLTVNLVHSAQLGIKSWATHRVFFCHSFSLPGSICEIFYVQFGKLHGPFKLYLLSLVYPAFSLEPDIILLWISSPQLPKVQTHRCIVHSSLDSSSPHLSVLTLRSGIVPL